MKKENVSEIKLMPINDLIGAEYNPRKISDKQINDLENSIKRFGITEPILINIHKDRKNIIISGHQRLLACKNLNIKEVPTVSVNLDIDNEKELNIRMNQNGGEFDFDLLDEFFDVPDLESWGFDSEDLEFNMGEINENDFFTETEKNEDIKEKKCPNCGHIL